MIFFRLLLLILSGSLISCDPAEIACTPTLYVATTDGFYKGLAVSNDSGNTWLDITPPGDSYLISSISASNNKIFATTPDGLMISDNGGHTWKLSSMYNPVSVYASSKKVVVGLYECKPGDICICGGNPVEVTVSVNGGLTWSPKRTPHVCGTTTGIYLLGDQVFMTLFSSGLAILEGATWKVLNAETDFNSTVPTCISGEGQNVYVGLDEAGGMISMSEDGGQTFRKQQTIPLVQGQNVNSIFASNGQVYVGTNGGGLSVSKASRNDWTVITKADGLVSNNLTAVAAVGDTIIVGSKVGLSISIDGGKIWVTKTDDDGLPQNTVTAAFATCVV